MGVALKGVMNGKTWLMLAALCVAGPAGAQSPSTGFPRQMTAEEAQEHAYILSMVKPGKPYVLNMGDPKQLAFTQHALTAAGRTTSTAPQTLAAVQSTGTHARALLASSGASSLAAKPLQAAVQGGPQNIATISNFGDDGSGTYTATGYSSVMGGTSQTTITTELFDTVSNTVYGSAANTQYASGTDFQVPVIAKVADATHLAAMTTIVTVVNDVSNTTVVSTAKMIPASTGTMTAPNYCVHVTPGDPNSNCVITNNVTQYQTASTTTVINPPPIKICFNRGSQQSCDYYNSSNRPATSVFFPSAGTAAFSGSTIDPSFPTAGVFTASIIDPLSGGGCVFSDSQPLGTGWSLLNASTLQWTLPQLSLTNPNACLKVTGGQLVNFNFYVEVPLTGSPTHTGFISLTSTYAPPMPPGYFGIPGLYLEDSCVAAGTQVRMADGTDVAIEKLTADNQPQVITAAGDKRTVLGTAKGVEIHPMIRLKTDQGQELLITRTHPVLTTNGLVMARDLKVGDSVRTEKGTAKIVSNAQENYSGLVYSLRLGWFNEAKSDRRTHTAGGIFIGDSISQIQMEQDELARLKTDKSLVLRRLPNDQWRAEYKKFIGQ